jgi:hypothetical protein
VFAKLPLRVAFDVMLCLAAGVTLALVYWLQPAHQRRTLYKAFTA